MTQIAWDEPSAPSAPPAAPPAPSIHWDDAPTAPTATTATSAITWDDAAPALPPSSPPTAQGITWDASPTDTARLGSLTPNPAPDHGAIMSGVASAYNAEFNAALDVTAPFAQAAGKMLGRTPKQVANLYQTARDTYSQMAPPSPDHPVANTIGRTVGGAAPILAATALGGPVGGAVAAATVSGTQGIGSAVDEGAREGYTASQTASLATERGAFNAILGLIPGSAGTGGILKEGAKAAAITYLTNLEQARIEAAVKQAVGIESDDAWTALKKAAFSGDNAAQTLIFGGVHAVSVAHQRAAETPLPTPSVHPAGDVAPATSGQTPPAAVAPPPPPTTPPTTLPPPSPAFDPKGPPRIPSAFDPAGPRPAPSTFDPAGVPRQAPQFDPAGPPPTPRTFPQTNQFTTETRPPVAPDAAKASLERMTPPEVARYAQSLGIAPKSKAENIAAIMEKTNGQHPAPPTPPGTQPPLPPSASPGLAAAAPPLPGGNDANRGPAPVVAPAPREGKNAPLIAPPEPTGPAKEIKPPVIHGERAPRTAAEMLLKQGTEDGLFPSVNEQGTGAIHPDTARGVTASERQGLRGRVDEDKASNETQDLNAQQIARRERAVVERFGANNAQRTAQAIEHYKNHPDPAMRMLAVQAEAEGTGATQQVKPATFNDGDKFKIGDRPFRVSVDADGNMHFIDDDVEIPYIDPNEPVKVKRGSIERAAEPEVPAGDFAPEVPEKKTTGPQQSLLGERHEGSAIGSKTAPMFGDVSKGPASKLEEAAPKSALEKKFENTRSGELIPLSESEHGPGAAGESDPNFIANTYQQDMGDVSPLRRTLRNVTDALTGDVIPKLTRAGASAEAVAHAKARDAVMPKVRDMLAKVFPDSYKDPEAMAKTIDIINKDNILGGYEEFYRRADAARKAGDTRKADAWIKKAEAVEKVHDISALDAEVQAAKSDPAISANIDRWKQHVEPLMNRLYNEMKRLDPNEPQDGRGVHFGARINLVDEAHLADWKTALKDSDKPLPEVGNASSYRNPDVKRDNFDQSAAFTGKYATDAETVLSAALARRMNETSKLRLIEKLQKQGVAWEDKPGAKRPEKLMGEEVARMEIRVPETNPETMHTEMKTRNLWVQKKLVNELRDVLNTDQHLDAPVLQSIGKVLNGIQLAGVVDFVAHGANLERAVANSLGEKTTMGDVIKKFPGVGSAVAVAKVAGVMREIYQDTPAIRAEMAQMAEAGLLRSYHEHTWWQKQGVALQHIDQSARVVMNRFYSNLVERGMAVDSPEGRYKFISQVGEYNRRLVGPATRFFRDAGLSPFVIAGRTFNRMGRRWLAGDPGFTATSGANALKARALMTAGIVMATATPMMINALTVGNPMGRAGTPVGAVDTGKTDEDGKPKIIDVLQITGVRRGMRSMGINALVEGIRQGKDWQTIGGNMALDILQSAMHPWSGPAPAFAAKVAFGKNLFDLRGRMEAQQIPGAADLSPRQLGENARAALESQNPLIYGFLRPALQKAGIDQTTETAGESIAAGTVKPVAGAIGIKSAPRPGDAAEDMAERLARAKFGDRGLTPDDARKIQMKRDLLRKVKAGDTEELETAVAAGKLTTREAALLTQKASKPALEWNLKSLFADDALLVYQVATPAEQAKLHDMVRDKILKSDHSAQDQDKMMAEHKITPPADLAIDREYADLQKKATADEKKKQQMESLVRQVRAAEQEKEWDKGAALRKEYQAISKQPQQLTGRDRARHEQLQQFRTTRGKLQQMVKEGSMPEDSAERRLAGLRGRLGG